MNMFQFSFFLFSLVRKIKIIRRKTLFNKEEYTVITLISVFEMEANLGIPVVYSIRAPSISPQIGSLFWFGSLSCNHTCTLYFVPKKRIVAITWKHLNNRLCKERKCCQLLNNDKSPWLLTVDSLDRNILE